MQLFLSGPGQIVFWAVYPSLVFLVPLAIVLLRRRTALPLKARFVSGNTAPRRFFGLFLILVIAILFGYVGSFSGIGLLPDWVYYLGLTFSLLGFAIWFWGEQTLGRYYSIEVVIYQDHQLVERGPFRFVRHPMYAGLYLLWLGTGLAVQSWAAAIVIAILGAGFVARGIQVEENALVSEFGEKYILYSKRTKRLLPFIF